MTFAVGIGVVLFAPAAAAQDRGGVRVTEEGVRLNFQGADLQVVIAALAELAGLTVVYGPLPNQPVTLRSAEPLSQEDARRLLESVARANGLAIVEDDGILRIEVAGAPPAVRPENQPPGLGTPAQEARAPRLFVHRLMHARAAVLAETLRMLFGLGGGRGNGGMVGRSLGLSEERSQGTDVPWPLDAQPGSLTGRAPPGSPADGALPGSNVPQGLTPRQGIPMNQGIAGGQGFAAGQGLAAGLLGPVQVVPHALTNSLLIRAAPADYETIRGAIDQLDVRPLQVLIEVLIAEVRRDRRFGLGIDIEVPNQEDAETGAIFGGELMGRSAGDVVLRVLRVGAVQADVVLHALAASGDVTVLSRPVVLAQNNQEARIMVGDERPFIQLFRTLPTEAAVRDQLVQYRDVGTELTIRPTINPDGYVTLHLLQEVSTATAETQFGAPIISTREAETQLLVRDGHTAIIGGLIDQQREQTETGVPILKDIPLFGALFRSTQWRRSTTELFLFLTPHVLRSDEDMDDAARDIRQETRYLRPELREPLPLLRPTPDSIRPDKGSANSGSASTMRVLPSAASASDEGGDFYGMIGRSQSMRTAYHAIELFARAPVAVVILGERGTGKELAARAIHQIAGRDRPFIPVNCAEISESLFESELFGHERGAFTGAIRRRDGLLARANGGILFLDEIGELPALVQSKLLRVLETGEYRPVGADRLLRSSFRVVAATNRNLARLASEELFRRDLLDRFGAARIMLPALRQRIDDVPALAHAFLCGYRTANNGSGPAGLAPDALDRLRHGNWRGNVRELRSVVEAAAAISSGRLISANDLDPFLTDDRSDTTPRLSTLRCVVRHAEEDAIREAIRRTGGDYDRAAALLGISVSTLYRKQSSRNGMNAGTRHDPHDRSNRIPLTQDTPNHCRATHEPGIEHRSRIVAIV